jgi:hypothetical protein
MSNGGSMDFPNHDIMSEHWIGVVHNNVDPTFSGRCQIKVFGILDEVNEAHLPWATPINSGIFAGNGAGSLSVPKIGTFVRVKFNSGDLYAPEYEHIQNVDPELIAAIKDDYQGAHVLLYDPIEELNIMFQVNSGIKIYYKGSFFQISPDTMITLQTPDNESIIQLEGDITRITTKNEIDITAAAKVSVSADEVIVNGSQITKVGGAPYFHAVLAEPMWALLSTMASALDAKYPPTPGVNVGLVEAAKQSATSTNVMIGK